ncbi:MAG: four helix bundle protein [Candidatus Omnitrophota bacterium]
MDNKKIQNFKDLKIWQESMEIVEEIYKVTKDFPKNEIYGIITQLRRSAVSIPSNIAEGFMRQYNKEFKQFLFIALGSSAEAETQLIISSKLSYITKTKNDTLLKKIERLNKMIMTLIKCL